VRGLREERALRDRSCVGWTILSDP
jgi:hypothetical protein